VPKAAPPTDGLPVRLMGARPSRIIPPQSPGCRDPGGCREVNTMGWVGVPLAMRRPPRCTIRVPWLVRSPLMMVPGSMVALRHWARIRCRSARRCCCASSWYCRWAGQNPGVLWGCRAN
jgi:hypothetical protein